MEKKNKNKIFFVNGRFCSNKRLKKFFLYTIGSTNHNRSKMNRIWSTIFELGPFSCMRPSAKNHNCTITIIITDYNFHDLEKIILQKKIVLILLCCIYPRSVHLENVFIRLCERC